MNYKQIWFDKYEEGINENMDEDEASRYADEYVSDYMSEKADYERQRRKEERFYE